MTFRNPWSRIFSFLSESSAQEIDGQNKMSPLPDSVIMFFSYFFAGFIPLAPYLILEISQAKYVSVAISLIALFTLGFLPTKNLKSGLKMAFIAGFAAFIGFSIAHIFSL